MQHYIAVVHKDETSCFGVFFPDVKGVFTAGDTLDDAFRQAREVLGWSPQVSLDQGLDLTIEWMRANLERYKPGVYEF